MLSAVRAATTISSGVVDTIPSVSIRRLTAAEEAEYLGPCSVCGSRRAAEPRKWMLVMNHPNWSEPSEKLACSRCRRTLRELAEMLLDDESLAGTLHLAADPPYYPP